MLSSKSAYLFFGFRKDVGSEPEEPEDFPFTPLALEEPRGEEEKREVRREVMRDQLWRRRRREDMDGMQLAMVPTHISTRL